MTRLKLRTLPSLLLLFPVMLCTIILLVNTGETESGKVTKYLPYFFLVPLVILSSFYSKQILYQVWQLYWPWVVLAAWIIISSLYARLYLGVVETAFPIGIGMLVVAPLVSYLVTKVSFIWISIFCRILLYVVYPISFIIYMYGLFGNVQVLHMEVFFLLPIPFLILNHFRINYIIMVVAVTLFLTMAIISHKNTAYLTALASLIWLVIVYTKSPSLNKNFHMLRVSAVVQLLIITSFVALFLILNRDEYLPSGSSIYRLYMYGLAWDYFLSSPWIGDGFLGTMVFLFEPYEIHGEFSYLPTHSDFLDILAHGGVLAALLFIAGIYKALVHPIRKLLPQVHKVERLSGFIIYIIAVAGSGFIALLVNPILLSPLHSFYLWFCVGAIGGLYLNLVGGRRYNCSSTFESEL